MKSDDKGQFLDPKNTLDFKVFARFLSAVEKHSSAWVENLVRSSGSSSTVRLGITGPPGAGKSTIISGLIREYRKKNLKVGVIAVDPSSPFSKGAVLGDRIRYSEHFEDKKVFIRSVGSRGAMGGISGSVYLMLRAFDIWKFDVVIVETVGVGQTELEIMNVADKVCVVVVPEFGDSIQALKAGILEIADLFVVNKCDRPGADVIAKELEHWAGKDSTSEGISVPVLKTVAHEHQGLSELVKEIEKVPGRLTPKKKFRAEAAALLRLRFEEKMFEKISKISSEEDLLKVLKNTKI